MPTNDFLPFATGAGANVENQATYASDPSTAAGFSAGIAQSAKLNKVWRQSSFVISGLAGVMMDTLGTDMIDNGDLAGFKSNLEAAIIKLQPRRQLEQTVNTVFVNASAGYDGNDGLTPTTAFQSVQYAYEWVLDNIDLGGQYLKIQLADGTYTAPDGQPILEACGILTGQTGYTFHEGASTGIDEGLTIIGNTANPSAVILHSTNFPAVIARQNAIFNVEGVTLSATGTTNPGECWGLWSADFSAIGFRYVNFDRCDGAHVCAQRAGRAVAVGPATITGDAPIHMYAAERGQCAISQTNLVGTRSFGTFVRADTLGLITTEYSPPVGTAVGQRYLATGNGVICTFGGGATFFPGDSAGTTNSGGQYI